MSETNGLARFIAQTDYEDLPSDVVDAVKVFIRDNIGVAIAGSTLDLGETIAAHVAATHHGSDASVIGGEQASVEGAAFANGTFGHAMDWDDSTPDHLTHTLSQSFPAALAAAEFEDATGRDLLLGTAVGIQGNYRVGMTSYPDHYFHGWHYTGTVGVFGAVAAAGSVLDLSVEEATHALGIAASCSAGLRKNNPSMTKPFHAGHAAQDGVRAALLAREGFTAHDEIFEGDIGYGTVYAPGGYDPTPIAEPLADGWDVLKLGFKPYPGATINHGAQLALHSIVEREDLAPDGVESITVTLDEDAAELLREYEPTDPFAGNYSIEFPLAAILRDRTHGIDQFTESYVRAPETREAMAKVERDFGFEEDGYDLWSARVTVRATDGTEFTEEERYSPKQHSPERIEAKFRDAAGARLSDDEIDRVIALVDRFEEQESVGELAGLLRA